MNKSNIDSLLQKSVKSFKLGIIKKIDTLPHGIGNKNFLIINENQEEFVIRILVAQTLKGLENEYAIQKQLGKVGVLTAQFLLGEEGKYYYATGGEIVTCSKKIAGGHPQSPNIELCKAVGEVLAKFHTSVTSLPLDNRGWLNKQEALEAMKTLPEGSSSEEAKQLIYDNIDIFDMDLPKGIIHGDLHLTNLVVTDKNEIAIFDFEEAENNLLILDIAKTVSTTCDVNNVIQEHFRESFLAGYESIRSLYRAAYIHT